MKSKVTHAANTSAWGLKTATPEVAIKVWYKAAADPNENAANREAAKAYILKIEKLLKNI